MITCPECGLQAPDDAKFCDRCGRGLTVKAAAQPALATRPTPLAPGTILKGEYEIVELLGQDSIENRYRAFRKKDNLVVQLRERIAPERDASAPEPSAEETKPEPPPPATPSSVVDPRAKTAELKPPS